MPTEEEPKFTGVNIEEDIIQFKDLTDNELEKLDDIIANEFDERRKLTIWQQLTYYVFMFFEAITLAFASAFLIGGLIGVLIFSPSNGIDPNFLYAIVAAALVWVAYWSLWKNFLLRLIYNYLFPIVHAWVKKKLKKK